MYSKQRRREINYSLAVREITNEALYYKEWIFNSVAVTDLEYDSISVPDGGVFDKHELRISDVQLQLHAAFGCARPRATRRAQR